MQSAVEGRGEQVFSLPRGVFGVVVVKSPLGHDLDDRQGLPGQHPNGHFGAGDKILDQDQFVVPQRGGDAGGEFVAVANDADADGRAFAGGFHHQREVVAAVEQQFQILAAPVDAKIGGRQLVIAQQLLGRHFIHGDARCQDSATGVGDAEHLEQSLHRAILAEASVQGDKGDFDALLRQARGQIPSGIDGHRQVAGLQEGGQHRLAGAQRDLPFGGEAAHEYADGLFL